MIPKSSEQNIKSKTILIVDIAIVIAVLVWVILVELGISPHIKQGFYCADKTISHKYNGDTISTTVLVLSAFVPFFLFWIFEAIHYKSDSLKDTRFKKSLIQAGRVFREYGIGILFHMFVLETIKVVIGELRPHFLDTCRPDAAQNCSIGTYIVDYVCTNKVDSTFFVRDSSKSFPSGHSSISVFEAIFMIWYLQYRISKSGSRIILPFLQCLCVIWASFCSISRIVDRRHHWWDVLAGVTLGFVFAVLTCMFLCKKFRNGRSRIPELIQQNGSTDRHTSVRRLLSDSSCKDEVTMNHVTIQ